MSQQTPIDKELGEIEDCSDVIKKIARYVIEKKLQELKEKQAEIKIDDGGEYSWETLLKKYRARWTKVQEEYDHDRSKKQADRHGRWDKDGFPKCKDGYRVAIIGAGVAGLRTAMLLQSRKIPYKIFEASDRPGGRLFTYHFPPKPPNNPQGKHDYYDVGGMRFPDNNANKETFNLFEELNEKSEKFKVIKYHFSEKNNIRFYNNMTSTEDGIKSTEDRFGDSEFVPDEYLKKVYTNSYGKKYYGAEACAAEAFDPFRDGLLQVGDGYKKVWDTIMEYDWASTKAYLAQGMNPTKDWRLKPNYPLSVVHWMETMNTGTGGYDQAFSETILDSFMFDDPSKDVDWHCLEGGSEVLINAMLATLNTKPVYNHRVTSIVQEKSSLRVSVSGEKDECFSHVVSTSTFANLRNINTEKVPMTYTQRQAIRTLHYGPAVKVAIKFKTRWWEKAGLDQRGGSSHSDRQSRVVVYPSYGIDEDGPGVLMVAYNWHQDASRFGALIAESDWSKQLDSDRVRPPSEEVLLEQIYDNLAAMHGPTVTEASLREDTLDYHAFDWYHNPHTMGAFAAFAPGQYSTFFPDIVQPAGDGRFHFAGEVASPQHAWVAGALDSAKRAVAEILRFDYSFLIPKFRSEYGRSDAFSDEKISEKRFLSGKFAIQLEEALKEYEAEDVNSGMASDVTT